MSNFPRRLTPERIAGLQGPGGGIHKEALDTLPDLLQPYAESGVTVPLDEGNGAVTIKLLTYKAISELIYATNELNRQASVVTTSNKNADILAAARIESQPFLDEIARTEAAVRMFEETHPDFRHEIGKLQSTRWSGRKIQRLIDSVKAEGGPDPRELDRQRSDAQTSWSESLWGAKRRLLNGGESTKLGDLEYKKTESDRYLQEADGPDGLTAIIEEGKSAVNNQYVARGFAAVGDPSFRQLIGLPDDATLSWEELGQIGSLIFHHERKNLDTNQFGSTLWRNGRVKDIAAAHSNPDTALGAEQA